MRQETVPVASRCNAYGAWSIAPSASGLESRTCGAAMSGITRSSDIMVEINPTALIDLNRLDRGADHHLRNWARWMRSCEYGIGYRDRAQMLTGCGSDTFDDMLDRQDRTDARIADAVIESLDVLHKCAIHNVYMNSVFTFKRLDPLVVFLDAAEAFWAKAQKRGLT